MDKQNVFDKILLDGVKNGMAPAKERAAREWFRNEAKKLKKTDVKENVLFRQEGNTFKNRTAIGRMYLFHYNPKHKKDASVLPFFDSLPLCIPFAPATGGFLGLNLHYLPHNYRAKLFDMLYTITNNKRFDDSTKLRISYEVIKGLAATPYYAPAIKHYLSSHVASKFVEIQPVHWDIALFMPLERFSRGGTLAPMSKTEVWKDSVEKIRNAGKK